MDEKAYENNKAGINVDLLKSNDPVVQGLREEVARLKNENEVLRSELAAAGDTVWAVVYSSEDHTAVVPRQLLIERAGKVCTMKNGNDPGNGDYVMIAGLEEPGKVN